MAQDELDRRGIHDLERSVAAPTPRPARKGKLVPRPLA